MKTDTPLFRSSLVVVLCAASIMYAQSEQETPLVSTKKEHSAQATPTGSLLVNKHDQHIRVAYVDSYKALNSSLLWKEKNEKAQTETEKRIQNINKIKERGQKTQEELSNMRGTASDGAVEKKQKEIINLSNEVRFEEEALQQFAQNALQKAQMETLQSIEEATKEVVKVEGIDLVLAGAVLYADETLDITQEVVTYMNTQFEKNKTTSFAKTSLKDAKENPKLAKIEDKNNKSA